MSKTYAEAIRDCLEKDINDKKMFSLPFERICSGLAVLQIHIAKMVASENEPDAVIAFGGEKIKYNGKANISEFAILRLINGSDLLSPKGMKFTFQWSMFITWLLNEEIPTNEYNDDEDFEPIIWYETDTLRKKYNEYAEIRNKELQNND